MPPWGTTCVTGSATLTQLVETVVADSKHSVRFIDSHGITGETTWAEIVSRAVPRAATLQALGVAPGDRVAVLAPTSAATVETLFAIWLAGGAAVMLPLPSELATLSNSSEQTRARIRSARARVVVTDPATSDGVGENIVDPVPLVDQTSPGRGGIDFQNVEVDPSDIALVQFTSGTTTRPRAVLLSHQAVCANLFAVADAIEIGHDDRALSWLPLYHDMGVIGMLMGAASSGLESTFMPTRAFALRPGLWMRACSTFGATITTAPNFAFGLAARTLARTNDLDLSPLRVVLCGAEPINEAIMTSFIDAAGAAGMRSTAVMPCYGLAEATLAVTICPLDRPLTVDSVQREALERDGMARPSQASDAKRLVGLGFPIRGTTVAIVDSEGHVLGEREVGEVAVASRSLMSGYDDQGATEGVLDHGWLRTGDLGYLARQELFLCGRLKDVIIVNGRNIAAQDIEMVAEAVQGVRFGNVAAFSVEDAKGHEEVVVVAEVRVDADRAGPVTVEVREEIARATGVRPRSIVAIAGGALPKTSSGKVQRSACRQQYLAGDLEPIAEASL